VEGPERGCANAGAASIRAAVNRTHDILNITEHLIEGPHARFINPGLTKV
jgi:hypothetical protein